MSVASNGKTVIKSLNENVVYFTSGSKLYAWNLEDLSTRLITEINGNALATKWGSNSALYFFNARRELIEYNVVTAKKTVTQLDIPALPVRLNYIALGVDNKIWTGGYLTGSNSIYDPATEEVKNYPGLHQTESMTFLGSNVYFGIYPSSRIYKFDSKKTWNVTAGNPKLVGRIEGQDRPFGRVNAFKLGLKVQGETYYPIQP